MHFASFAALHLFKPSLPMGVLVDETRLAAHSIILLRTAMIAPV